MHKEIKQMIIRGFSEELLDRLDQLSRELGQSRNRTILKILNKALGIESRTKVLERQMTWNQKDLEEFEQSLALQRTIDDELWRS